MNIRKGSAPAVASRSISQPQIDEAGDPEDIPVGADEKAGGRPKLLNRNVIGINTPAAALGAIEGLADAVSSFAKLGAGWLGDRLKRRKPMIAEATR